MTLSDIGKLFRLTGVEFLTSPKELKRRLKSIRAFVFDWDGVFNSGAKGRGKTSSFSEADSMGINLLRFAFWLNHKTILYTAIVTGEKNPSAIQLAERERFHSVFVKTNDKRKAVDFIVSTQKIEPSGIACCFDDVADLGMAGSCGLRFLIRREGSPLFLKYAKERKLADYVSGKTGGQNAVREICELVLGLNGDYDRAITSRIKFDPDYREYMKRRNEIKPVVTSLTSK